MKKLVLVVPVLALALSGTTACATKKFVRTNVGEVNDKVDTLSKSSRRTRSGRRPTKRASAKSTSEPRRRGGDQKAAQAGSRADEAYSAAEAVNARADAIEKASRRLVYEVVLSEDKGNFKFGKAAMPDEAKAELDTLVQQLKAEPKGAYIEIEGHTDSAGTPDSELQAGPRARREREALSLRAAPGAAPPHQRDQLRRRQADRAEQDAGRPRAEPPRRHQGAHLEREPCPRRGASSSRRGLRRRGFRRCHRERRSRPAGRRVCRFAAGCGGPEAERITPRRAGPVMVCND